ncbi:MAG: hypothetical protein OEM05_07185 [Myxococcales bacterium]|nr:hypothetical protein [Myxococcales bacterium]
MSRMALWVLPFLALLASACADPVLVKPERCTVQGTYHVEPQITWTRVAGRWGDSEDNEVWTVDGARLESILFTRALADGDPLFHESASKKDLEKLPVYREYMSELEIMDLVTQSLTRIGAAQVDARNLRPAVFGGSPGFRFELEYVSEDGLEYAGLVKGAVLDRQLYLIVYRGTALHYYAKYLPHVEGLLDSIALSAPDVAAR